jgi:hypothetical protein
MYAASVETDRLLITLIFSGILRRKLSDETGTVKQVLIPLKPNLPQSLIIGNFKRYCRKHRFSGKSMFEMVPCAQCVHRPEVSNGELNSGLQAQSGGRKKFSGFVHPGCPHGSAISIARSISKCLLGAPSVQYDEHASGPPRPRSCVRYRLLPRNLWTVPKYTLDCLTRLCPPLCPAAGRWFETATR